MDDSVVVIAFAALTGPLPKVGVIAVALLAAAVLLIADRRARAVAMLAALVLAPVLLLAEIWHSPQLGAVHRHPLEAIVAAAVLVAVAAGVAALVRPRPWVIAPLAVLTLPFRIPIAAGGTAANLLVPLYGVVAIGALAWIFDALRGVPPGPEARGDDAGGEAPPAAGAGTSVTGSQARWAVLARRADLATWAERLLAAYVVVYAVQAAYSPDFTKALQNVVFFYVPFALLYRLLRELTWTGRLLRHCLRVTAVLAVVFSLVGFYEYATKTILLNPKLVVQNNLHTYFTVNSFFFDPDIFGRYLALVLVLLAVGLIYGRVRRDQARLGVVLVILWACLVLTLSRSGLGTLLVGLGVLAALRWKPSRALVVAVVIVAAGAVAVAVSPRTFGLNQGINGASSGRGGLVSEGVRLLGDRPVWGFGSGSFSTEYIRHTHPGPSVLSESHTIPVTIAAEQGMIGLLVYLGFLVAAISGLVRGARGDPVRSAVAAAFIALMFDTLLYADFLEDPTTWVLLAVGLALARSPVPVALGQTSPTSARMRAGAADARTAAA